MRSEKLTTLITGCALAAMASLSFVLPDNLGLHPVAASAGEGDDSQRTGIDEIIMYGIDSDTNQLLRLTFSTGEYEVIGEVRTEHGQLIEDVENLGWIPNGLAKGLYCVPHAGFARGKFVKISVMDATATVYPPDLGWDEVTGMVRFIENGKWMLLAADKDKDELIKIDPGTGDATRVASIDHAFEGLAKGPDGTTYGLTYDELYRLDPATGNATLIGAHGFPRVESLEYAFGDYAPEIDVPGVPDEWTADGVLFAFSDDDNALMIMNPASGESVEWVCEFSTVDCEGLIFVTRRTDPRSPMTFAPYD